MQINGQGRATNSAWATSSDERVKTNIQDLESGLDVVMQLRPRTFNFTKGYSDNKENNIGFIGQEVENVLPQAISIIKEEMDGETIEDFRLLDTSPLVPILINKKYCFATKVFELKKNNYQVLKLFLQS